MAIDWSQVGQNLATLPGNPLFDLGIGLMANSGAAPYGTTFGQRLAGALGDMGQIQKNIADQQYIQQQRAQAEQDRQDMLARRQKLNDALTNGPYADNKAFQALAAANPEAAASWMLKQQQADSGSPWQFDAKSGTMINTATGQFKPLTMFQAPGQPGFTPPAIPSGLPQETQAYVPKVMGALGGAQAFQNGQPTPQLLDAVQRVESGGNPNAVSPAGAQGAYQLMPATAASVGVTNPMDPAQARAGAAQYLAQLYKQFGGNPQLALAAYNAGPGRVQAAQGQPQAPMTLAQYEAQRAEHAKPGLIQQRAEQWQQLVQAGAVDPSNTALRNQYLLSGKAAGFQGSETAPTLGDISKSGTDYIGTLSPSDRDVVQSYIDGRQAVPTGTALKNPHIMSLVQAAYHADPELEAGTFNSRVKTRQAFTSAAGLNSPASQIRTLNTASGHLNQLLGDVLQLDNGDVNAVNATENYLGSKVGNTKFTNLKADLTPVVSEVASLYKGGQATDAEIKSMMDSFPINGSKSQQISVIERWIGLLHSKLGALNTQYAQGMGSMSQPLTTVSPQAAAALQNITRTYKTLGLPLPATIGEAHTSAGGDSQQTQTAAPPGIDAILSKYGVH